MNFVRSLLAIFCLLFISPLTLEASSIDERQFYYRILLDVPGTNDTQSLKSQACPRSSLLSFFIQRQVTLSIEVSASLPSTTSLITTSDPIFSLTSEGGGKCNIVLGTREFSGIFVPAFTKNLPSRFRVPIKVVLHQKVAYDLTFLSGLTAAMQDVTSVLGASVGLINKVNAPERQTAISHIESFLSTSFAKDFSSTQPESFILDLNAGTQSYKVTSFTTHNGKTIPIKLRFNIDRFKSVISAQDKKAEPKYEQFGDWRTQPISYGSSLVTGNTISVDSTILPLSVSKADSWVSNCGKARAHLINHYGLNATDTAFMIAKMLFDETSEFENFNAPLTYLANCGGINIVDDLKRLGVDVVKLNKQATDRDEHFRKAYEAAIIKSINDLSGKYQRHSSQLMANVLLHYLSDNVSLIDSDLLLSDSSEYVTSSDRVSALLATAQIQRLGCISVPHSIDYSMIDVYGLLRDPTKQNPVPILFTWQVDKSKLLSDEKFITSVGLRKLDLNSQSDQELASTEVLANINCDAEIRLLIKGKLETATKN